MLDAGAPADVSTTFRFRIVWRSPLDVSGSLDAVRGSMDQTSRATRNSVAESEIELFYRKRAKFLIHLC